MAEVFQVTGAVIKKEGKKDERDPTVSSLDEVTPAEKCVVAAATPAGQRVSR